MRITTLALLGIGLSLVACRGGDDSGDDAPGNPDGGTDVDAPPSGAVRIQDVQNESMQPGTAVSLKGVVVTAVDAFGARTGDLYIQDPAGGPFSGVKVFGASLDQVAVLAAGDIIDLTGAVKEEFAYMTDTSGLSVTELKPASAGSMRITKTGTGSVPDPVVVDALAIEMMPSKDARNAEWEKWEGVLISVTKARQIGPVEPFGGGAPDQQKFKVTGGLVVESVLSEFGATAVDGTCYQTLIGIGDYFFDYLLLPRDSSDLVAGGTGCQATAVTTIGAIQAGTVTGPVELHDVYVSAIAFNNKNLWVSTSLNAAAGEGIYVYRGSAAPVLDATVAVGARVNITATAAEFNNDQTGETLTQLTGPTITVAAPATTAPVPVTGLQASTLIVAATGEPYESVLVTLTGVKVNSIGDSANFYVGQLQQGATTFLSDDDVLRLAAADVGKCFDMTGLWTYQVYENAYGLLPITKTEVVCP